MSNYIERLSFSVIPKNGRYFIQCDETGELMTNPISSKQEAEKLLKRHVDTEAFKEASKTLTKEEIVSAMGRFNGRLRPKKKPWTIEEATLVASIYNTRVEFYKNSKKCYSSAYRKGWMDQICKHMKPSRKVNKFVYGVLNPSTALAKVFDYKTHLEFCKANEGAYNALRRFGVNTVELFEHLDDAEYLKNVIRKLSADAVDRLIDK